MIAASNWGLIVKLELSTFMSTKKSSSAPSPCSFIGLSNNRLPCSLNIGLSICVVNEHKLIGRHPHNISASLKILVEINEKLDGICELHQFRYGGGGESVFYLLALY